MRRTTFATAFREIPGQTLRGFFFRSIPLEHVNTPLNAIGSKRRGGRYNAAQTFQVYYLTDRVDATLYETGAIAAAMSPRRVSPIVTFTVDVDLQHVVDLTNPAVLASMRVCTADLLVEWKSLVAAGIVPMTHDIGAAARAAAVEALRVPSARLPGATNLAIIVDNLRRRSTLRINPDTGFNAAAVIIAGSR